MKRLSSSLSSLSAWVVQPLLVFGILVVGFVAASRLSLRREPPQRSESAAYAPLVRALVAEPRAVAIEVQGNGTLAARTRIELVPQVGGAVVAIHPGLRSGGRFERDDVLLRIERSDFELAVERAAAEVALAETTVATTRAESEAAIAEWERLSPGEACPPLVALEPQVRAATARVRSAEVALDQAALDLARTELMLPFSGRVVEATVDVGQVIAAGRAIGVVYATDVFEVSVPLRASELGWLDLPGASSNALGSEALVRGHGARGPVEIAGRIARVGGELDSRSRLVDVVVELRADGPADGPADEPAGGLLPGTFVDVVLRGRTVEDVVAVPRGALREDGVVWGVLDGRLRFLRPRVVYAGGGAVLVEGLEAGTRIVTSNLEVVTDGMAVRVEEAAQ